MKLLVDIGNSRIKWSCCEDLPEQSSAIIYSPGDLPAQLAGEWYRLTPPDAVYVANVAGTQVADVLGQYSREHWGIEPVFLSVSRDYDGLINAYQDVQEMGVDRWLALIAGWTSCRNNLCIVSAGTAITLDLVLADGSHLGGYILPGRYLMQQMLNRRTSGIEVDLEEQPALTPGRSTSECVHNGVYLAITALVERVIREHQERCGGEFRCMITGGDARIIKEHTSLSFDWEPDLVLKGMAIVSGDGK